MNEIPEWIKARPDYLKMFEILREWANKEPTKVLVGRNLIEVKENEILTTMREVGDKFGCSHCGARDILILFEKYGLIVLRTLSKGGPANRTVITIL
jgi:hypothetical protein